MDQLTKLIKKIGGKQKAAEKLQITVRYIDMILSGQRKPGPQLKQLINIYLNS